eukprot:CAMPEP_0170480522 /NCGR_PEP_ID=MMETSP0208-20121228/1330_1 /TAXON_ID=197538 /ORGANISM="Strombidium inclinatum, Strain S3" /LENGTH=53 /DNA_ID=CAMNT_0010753083 /DNA_START=1315 /DNA_END=1476 /DNA_ORIENTATION=+
MDFLATLGGLSWLIQAAVAAVSGYFLYKAYIKWMASSIESKDVTEEKVQARLS